MSKKRVWENELKPLVGYVPDFQKTIEEIMNAFWQRLNSGK